MTSLPELVGEDNPLAEHYRHFRVSERTLLSGHSHQAWPDRGLEAQSRAWIDAAEHVDDKWGFAFDRAERVRDGYRRLLDDPDGCYSLGPATHDLLVKLISALPLRERPRLVTTEGEFHSLRRQLDRLAEEAVEIVKVPDLPAADVGERLAAAVTDRTSAVFTSTVFFGSGHVAGDLSPAAEACRRHGAILLLDVYHQLNVVPFSLSSSGLLDAFVTGAGYKYCQLGEGNAFLRFPADCRLRPVATGWFAEFGQLAAPQHDGRVSYSEDRFGGATYDPTSHYRGAAVFDFFSEQQLDPDRLRRLSQAQMGILVAGFDALDLDPAIIDRDRGVPLDAVGGFLALTTKLAGELYAGLKQNGVYTDYRNRVLRLGPAPYVSRRQLVNAVALLGELVAAAS